jgi:hypothetical protein
VTTEEFEVSDYGRAHGRDLGTFWILLLFPLATVDYVLFKWAILVIRLVLGV